MQNWKRNWLAVSKLKWGVWRILAGALENLKHLDFHGLPLTKAYNAWAKKVQGSYVWWHWILMQNLKEKMTCIFKNDMRNLGNFHQSIWKSQNWDFDGILLSNVENAWA